MESSFRVLINLTHDSLPWCRAVLEDPLALLTVIRSVVICHRERASSSVKRENTDELDENDIVAQLLDRMCLALGVLTNCIQNDRTAHISLRDLSK